MTNNEQNAENGQVFIEQLMQKITEQSPDEASAQRAIELAMEIVVNHGKVNLDAEDVKRIVDAPGTFAAFDVVIVDDCVNRGDELVNQIAAQTAGFGKINNFLFYFFCSNKHELRKDDIDPFSEWISANLSDCDIIWGTTEVDQAPYSLRAIVLLSHD
ncbi:MAG: hypothetical protein IK053_03995 [Muribaculaceae bacterium]|nr:hypothetical protein [Muribaculaceae bacterium]